jgi:hypothetical protein
MPAIAFLAAFVRPSVALRAKRLASLIFCHAEHAAPLKP